MASRMATLARPVELATQPAPPSYVMNPQLCDEPENDPSPSGGGLAVFGLFLFLFLFLFAILFSFSAGGKGVDVTAGILPE